MGAGPLKGIESGDGPLSRIKVKVAYFAQAREFAGTKEDEVVLESPADVEQLLREVISAHPKLQAISVTTSTLVNGRVVPKNVELNDGDRVAFLPPVAGG
jgi:molybdopterin synthase sulfur carrier subunit